MNKLLLSLIILSASSSFAADFSAGPEQASTVIDALQSIISRDGIPYSPEYLKFAQNQSGNSFMSSATMWGLLGTGLVTCVTNLLPWKPVVSGVVEVGKEGVNQYKKKVDSDIALNKRIEEVHDEEKEALEQINCLTMVQLQMLAMTEGNNGNTCTYFRDLYKKAAINQQNKLKETSQKSSFPSIQCKMITK